MDLQKFNSIQNFGYNRFHVPHSVLGSYNMGIAYPLGFIPVPIGGSIQNSIEIFMRSSQLVDPSFLDCDVNIGHYFVSYEAMDPWYKIRAQRFKGKAEDQETLQLYFPSGSTFKDLKLFIQSGTLLDHLGFGIKHDSSVTDTTSLTDDYNLNAYPLLAYHMIVDRFFRNSRLQDVELTRKFVLANFSDQQPVLDYKRWSYIDEISGNVKPVDLLSLRTINFEPDYFTTARPDATGKAVSIPSGAQGTIPNLLDAMLLQKVADMIEHGGYSYNDYARILYGQEPNNDECDYPVFLGGSSGPLQVSTVVNQTPISSTSDSGSTDGLGEEAGRITAYVSGGNGFSRRFTRGGIYMPIMWIRPKTYYQSGVTPFFREISIGAQLVPQLADMQDAPIYSSEVAFDDLTMFGAPIDTSVFGYKDRYQEYRSIPSRVIGDLRQIRTGWYIARTIDAVEVSDQFISQDNLVYSPWVVTDKLKNHFFGRVHHDMTLTEPLPMTSRPWVW